MPLSIAVSAASLVPNVHVLRPVDGGVAGQRGHHVAAEVVDVGHDPAQLGLPGVPVGVDETGGQDRAGGVDGHRTVRAQVRSDRGDGVAFDEQVAVPQDAQFRVHRDDGGAGEQDASLWIGGPASQLFE